MTGKGKFRYISIVFAAVICEFSSDDHGAAVSELLNQYGFKATLKNGFESTTINEVSLNRLKKDIDKVTDSYDIIRFYQYPIDNGLVITSLKDKKWRRIKLKET